MGTGRAGADARRATRPARDPQPGDRAGRGRAPRRLPRREQGRDPPRHPPRRAERPRAPGPARPSTRRDLDRRSRGRSAPVTVDAPPDRIVVAPDGVTIAVFRSGTGPSIVLVHGATADHTTWRTSGPLLAAHHTLHAIDRRGRGASGDGRPDEPYAIEREFDDLVAVVEGVAE